MTSLATSLIGAMSTPVLAVGNGFANVPAAVEHRLSAPSVANDVNIEVKDLKDLTFLSPPKNQVGKEGETVHVAFAATAAGAITYEATGLPPGLSVDSASGIVSGVLAPLSADDYPVTIKATSQGRWEMVSFFWTVLDVTLPQLASSGVQVNTGGEAVSLQLVATDARTSTLTYGAFGLPPGLAVDAATGKISGTIADHDVRTSYHVTLTVDDGHVVGGTVFTWVVINNK